MSSWNSHRTIIIGLDGMPYRLINDLAESGVMPNTKRIIEQGTFRKMRSSIPEISSVAWSSVMTGLNPGYHGIFGFTDVPDGTYRLSFPNFADLKASPFWDHEGSGRSVIVNLPFTYPAPELNGVLIAGFVALDLKRATYPQSLIPTLNEMGYQIDVDSSAAHKSMDLFLKDLDKTLDARIEAYRYLWDKEDWQTFMLVFTGTDRLGHFLWDAYEDRSHKHHSAFLDHLHKIDKVVGEITGKMRDDDSLIMLSDHGFESSEAEVQMNFFLSQEGFLKFRNDPPRSLADIDYGTKAFALDPARIYINLEGKYPGGSVKPEERESLIEELKTAFESLEVNGRKLVKRVCRKEEIYDGPHLDHAPDLVLLSNSGFDLKSSLKAKQFSQRGIFTGKHSQEDAFLLINSASEDIIPQEPSVSDVVGVMDRLAIE
ncbi:MAG: alkaline phosphatase family protein [Dehalococcoidia bacterium]